MGNCQISLVLRFNRTADIIQYFFFFLPAGKDDKLEHVGTEIAKKKKNERKAIAFQNKILQGQSGYDHKCVADESCQPVSPAV